MRHKNKTETLGKSSSHRRCMFANMLKSLIFHGKITTTLPKAKALRSYADQMITLAKRNDLASRRRAIGDLMIRFNPLTPKERREVKGGDTSSYNIDRQVINILFTDLGPRFKERKGGYTRITKEAHRVGDNAQSCVIEYLAD